MIVHVRELRGEPEEVAQLQRVLEEAPTYAARVTGEPVGASDAANLLEEVPPGAAREAKFVLGIFVGESEEEEGELGVIGGTGTAEVMVGCADLIRGYPTPQTAMLGLLLISEEYQRRSLGTRAFAQVEEFARGWGTCDRIRIGVVQTNDEVLEFWQKLGFMPTGEVRPYRSGRVVSETVALEKALDRRRSDGRPPHRVLSECRGPLDSRASRPSEPRHHGGTAGSGPRPPRPGRRSAGGGA